jgi:5-methylcytosine-specific restriction enzyme subunit McrC
LRKPKPIQVFEHGRLTTTEDNRFEQRHLNALLKLNEYHQYNYFEAIPNGIKFNQYVGIIQVDGLTIEILPKADKDDPDNKWKNLLLQMLKACGKLKASSAGAANVNRQHLNLLEVYFELYISEIDSLIRTGLAKQYRTETSNVKTLKGKLEFAGNIRQNLIHKERFYTTHQVYDQDHLLHQVLYKALDIVEQFSRGSYLYDSCRRTMLNFPEVEKIKVDKKHLDKIVLNRKTSAYSYALEIARLIILNYSPDISSGKEKMLSLLFDMNKLWEEFILVQLRKALENTNYEVTGQDTRPFLGSNYLQPDVVIQNRLNQRETYIIDTKWKRPLNSSASVADLRQMYAYNRFWKAEKAMLLYPGNLTNNKFREFKTDDYNNTNNGPESILHKCKMGFVSVLDKDNNLNENVGEEVLKLLESEFI